MGHITAMEWAVGEDGPERVLASGKLHSLGLWCVNMGRFGPDSIGYANNGIWADSALIASGMLITEYGQIRP